MHAEEYIILQQKCKQTNAKSFTKRMQKNTIFQTNANTQNQHFAKKCKQRMQNIAKRRMQKVHAKIHFLQTNANKTCKLLQTICMQT